MKILETTRKAHNYFSTIQDHQMYAYLTSSSGLVAMINVQMIINDDKTVLLLGTEHLEQLILTSPYYLYTIKQSHRRTSNQISRNARSQPSSRHRCVKWKNLTNNLPLDPSLIPRLGTHKQKPRQLAHCALCILFGSWYEEPHRNSERSEHET